MRNSDIELMDVLLVGSAGSGKSTLVESFGRFLKDRGYCVARANFDPACKYLPYKPDFDIRDFLSVDDIMRREKIGPNTAIIRAYEIASKMKEFKLEADFVLIDTPGQLEVFLLRDTGERFLQLFRNPVVLLLNSAEFLRSPDYVALRLISAAINFKLGVECIPLISKADKKARELSEAGVYSEFMLRLNALLEEFSLPVREVAVSSFTGDGFEELLNLLYEIGCACGDLT